MRGAKAYNGCGLYPDAAFLIFKFWRTENRETWMSESVYE